MPRLLAIGSLLVLLAAAPNLAAAAAPRDIVAGAEGEPHGASPPSFQPYPSAAYDDPGAPYGYPGRDTFGYTVESLNESRWFDYSANDSRGANVIVDMGSFNRMHMTDLRDDYWVDVEFDARIRMWDDADGHYEPNNSRAPAGQVSAYCASGYQVCIGPDDPCPAGDFPIMDVYAGTTREPSPQDVLLRTVYGGDMTGCSGFNATEAHTFSILPDAHRPGEPAGRFHIPKWLLGTGDMPSRDCFVRLRFVPRDLTLPHYAPGHDASQHGVSINVTSVMVQLVAPPTVINHGYAAGLNPPTEILPNQIILQHNLRQAMVQNFGQDPWEWAATLPFQGIFLNSYDRKQDFRVSAQELATKVTQDYKSHWTGKIWLHGQSMGGLVARYYVEQLGGDAHVEKLAQTASPNTGSFEPLIYNFLFQSFYSVEEDSPINTHLLWLPQPPCPFVFTASPPIWKTWHTAPPGNVFTYHCGFAHGRSRMADFELRPANVYHNPILKWMNEDYLAAGAGSFPPYFSVRAQIAATPGFDGAVALHSASLNGAIGTRTIKAFHEDTPSQPQTAVYFSRFFGDLDLDTAYPKWCTPHETRTPHVIVDPANPGDALNPNASPDYAGNVTENATIELYLSTKGVVPFDNSSDSGYVEGVSSGGDAGTAGASGGSDAVLIDNERIRFPVDAIGTARIAVHSSLDLPSIPLTLEAPGGGAARSEYREDTHGWTRVQTFTLEKPVVGDYQLVVGPTAYATPFVLLGSWPSRHALSVDTDAETHQTGDPVTIRARVTGVGAGTIVDAVARVPTREGFVSLPLVGSDGVYSGEWTPPEPGSYEVIIAVQGFTTVDGPAGPTKANAFRRELALPVLVEAKSTTPHGGDDAGTPGSGGVTPAGDAAADDPKDAATDAPTNGPHAGTTAGTPEAQSRTPGPGVGLALLAIGCVCVAARRRRAEP